MCGVKRCTDTRRGVEISTVCARHVSKTVATAAALAYPTIDEAHRPWLLSAETCRLARNSNRVFETVTPNLGFDHDTVLRRTSSCSAGLARQTPGSARLKHAGWKLGIVFELFQCQQTHVARGGFNGTGGFQCQKTRPFREGTNLMAAVRAAICSFALRRLRHLPLSWLAFRCRRSGGPLAPVR